METIGASFADGMTKEKTKTLAQLYAQVGGFIKDALPMKKTFAKSQSNSEKTILTRRRGEPNNGEPAPC